MTTATAPDQMAKRTSTTPEPKPEKKTLKCSLATYLAVRRVANLRNIDMADYVDEVLLPLAERDLQIEAKKLIRGEKPDR